MTIALLTVGSRGDVQPFVALALGLQRAGHDVTLAAPSDAEALAAQHDVPFTSLGVDFRALTESPEARGALAGRPRDLLRMVRQGQAMTRRMLDAGGEIARDADAVVYHPKALVGPHLAEATGMPVFLAMPAPLAVPTRAFPIPIAALPDLGPLNRLTYAIIRLGMLPYHGIINAWRAEALDLPPRGWWDALTTMPGLTLPVLYAFSPTLVPRPTDWPRHVRVTGTWHLDGAAAPYTPDSDLAAFLDAGAPPVYVGFGSMARRDPEATTAIVLEAVRRAGVRTLLATGWGGLTADAVPPEVHVLDAAPHDWLFPRCAAVVHHGGAGTTAAGLRAGRPSVICPFFGDQHFWGQRVHTLGAGPPPLPQKTMTPDRLAAAIDAASTDPALRRRAATLGHTLQREDGVGTAVASIEQTLAALRRRRGR